LIAADSGRGYDADDLAMAEDLTQRIAIAIENTQLYEEICNKNKEACEDLQEVKPAKFYLCGWKAMIDDARQKIAALGYDKKSVHLELYG